MTPDVIVVGGGVIGCSIAYHLSQEQHRVLLLERDTLAARASGAAAGMLAPLAESESDGPLRRFGLESLARFPALAEELRARTHIDVGFEPSGILRVARSENEACALREQARQQASLGLAWLDAAAARERCAELASEVRGALWSPREGHLESPLLTFAYARAARSLGARIECGTSVVGLMMEGERVCGVRTPDGVRAAGQVVLAAGCGVAALAAGLGAGRWLPVVPVRGQILSLEAPLSGPDTIVWGGSIYLVPKRDARVVVGATEERVGDDCRVTAAGLRALLAGAETLVPAISGWTFRSAWAGLRPDTPDHLPLLGAIPGIAGLTVAGGHHRNGVLLSPVTGRLVADLLAGKELPVDARAFDPARFGAASR